VKVKLHNLNEPSTVQYESPTVGQNNFSLFELHAGKRVITDQQEAIKVGIVHQWREMSGSSSARARTGDHSSEHDFQVAGTGY
jgi:hypothetical protein